MNRRIRAVALVKLAGFAVCLRSSSAWASFTKVLPNSFGQPGPGEILSHIYQTPLAASEGNYAGGSIVATRLSDDDNTSGLLNANFVARAVARFSDASQSFGVVDGSAFSHTFAVVGENYNVVGQGTVHVSPGQSFARSGNSGTQSSTSAQNSDGRVHLVTFEVHGAPSDPQWVQFWEDLNDSPTLAKGRTKSDYNDLVVQLTPATAGGQTIPLPPAFASGVLLGLCILGINTKRAVRRYV